MNAVFVISSAVCFGWLIVGIVPCPLMGRQNPSVLSNPYVFEILPPDWLVFAWPESISRCHVCWVFLPACLTRGMRPLAG